MKSLSTKKMNYRYNGKKKVITYVTSRHSKKTITGSRPIRYDPGSGLQPCLVPETCPLYKLNLLYTVHISLLRLTDFWVINLKKNCVRIFIEK